MIKDIVKNLELSSTLRINEISKELENQGKEIFKFGFGQSPFEVPEDVVNELKNNAFKNKEALANPEVLKQYKNLKQLSY